MACSATVVCGERSASWAVGYGCSGTEGAPGHRVSVVTSSSGAFNPGRVRIAPGANEAVEESTTCSAPGIIESGDIGVARSVRPWWLVQDTPAGSPSPARRTSWGSAARADRRRREDLVCLQARVEPRWSRPASNRQWRNTRVTWIVRPGRSTQKSTRALRSRSRYRDGSVGTMRSMDPSGARPRAILMISWSTAAATRHGILRRSRMATGDHSTSHVIPPCRSGRRASRVLA